MNIDEAKAFAAEHVVDALCSGKDFRGLGSVARYLIMALAKDADDNAKFISQETTRTASKYMAMEKAITEDFVLGILGMGLFQGDNGLMITSRTPTQAAAALVDHLWSAYINWAHEAVNNPGAAEAAKVQG